MTCTVRQVLKKIARTMKDHLALKKKGYTHTKKKK